MSPRRLDPDALHEKLTHMQDLLRRLESLGPMTRERLEADELDRAAGERWLTLLVEAPDAGLIDVRQAAAFVADQVATPTDERPSDGGGEDA